MVTDQAVADVLGIGGPRFEHASLLRLMRAVESGLPLAALDRIVRFVAPGDASFAFRVVPKATLARRRKGRDVTHDVEARLSPDEGARVARLAEVWAFARDVWGSEEEARAFLFRPHALLDERRPVDVVLASEFGRPIVEGILGRLKYGSAV
jgi:putative toxin-antitoxin system antitoxin component (TIGR02293 family)